MKTRELIIILIVLALSGSAQGQWTENGLPIAADEVAEPVIARTSDGDFIVAGIRGTTVHLQKYDLAGNTLWNDVLAFESVDVVSNLAMAPTDDGGVFVFYVTTWHDVGAGNQEDEVRFRRFDADGAETMAAVTMNSASFVSGTPGGFLGLQAQEDGLGGCIFGYLTQWTFSNYGLELNRIRPSSTSMWINNSVLITDPDQIQIESDGYGSAMIAWIDALENLRAERYNYYGVSQWGGGVGVSSSGYPVTEFSMTPWGQGMALVWRELRTDRATPDGDIRFVRVDQSGTLAGSEYNLDATTLETDQPHIAAVGNDEFAVVYRPGGDGATSIAWRWWNGSSFTSTAYYVAYGTDVSEPHIVTGLPYSPHNDNQSRRDILLTARADAAGGARGIMATRPYMSINGSTLYSGWSTFLTGMAGDAGPGAFVPDGEGGLVAVWHQSLGVPSLDNSYAQRIQAQGYWGNPGSRAHSALDVPADQGGLVNLAWEASRLEDVPVVEDEVVEYTLWRSIAAAAARQLLESGAEHTTAWNPVDSARSLGVVREQQLAAETVFWEYMESVAPAPVSGYARLVPTAFDSTAADPALHEFQVVTHTRDGWDFPSGPVTGYSVDNVAPGAPAGTAAAQSYAPLGVSLRWEAAPEADLADYVVHAGSAPDFVPGAGTLVAATTDTTAFLPGRTWGTEYFKVAARDLHENTGTFASFAPGSVSAVEPTPGLRASIGAHPNPFNPTTTIRYTVTRDGQVTLRVYDVSGRLVRSLVDTSVPSGTHEAVWHGRDTLGRSVASGMYFLELKAPDVRLTRRVMLVR